MDGSDNTNPSPGPGSYRKAEGLWYDDGNVVFFAGKFKFQLYKGILSAQSKKFRDLLASAEDANTVLGNGDDSSSPAIVLPDEGSDISYLFKAIFDPSFYMPPPVKHALGVTVSILRLAQKYEVQFLIRRAVLHLDSFFPLTQDGFRAFAPPVPQQTLRPILAVVSEPLMSLLSVLPLASSSADGAPWLIPRVIHTIVRRYPLGFIIAHPSFSLLTYDFQSLIGQGCITRALEESHQNSWVGMLPCSACASKENCASVARSAQEKNAEKIPGEEVIARALYTLENGRRFCQHCLDAGQAHKEKLAGKFWIRYAGICGFSSWEEVGLVRSTALTALG